MPWRSPRQRRFMHANHPRIAKSWDRKYGTKSKKAKKSSNRSAKRARSRK